MTISVSEKHNCDRGPVSGDIGEHDPEKAILLLCARTHPDAAAISRLAALLQEPIDWKRLLQLGFDHGVIPLLYWHLREFPKRIPSSILEQLQEVFESNLYYNLSLAGELRRVLVLFAEHGIQAIPLKGTILAQNAYGNLALRTFSDIDILIHLKDFSRVREVLASAGYLSPYPSTVQQSIIYLSHCHHQFVNASGESLIEIHWGIWVDEFFPTPDFADLMKNATISAFLGRETHILSPEDTLLFSCVNGSKHLWHRLQLVTDIAEIVRVNESLEWTEIVENAEKLGAERMLFLGVLLAHDLLAVSLPDAVANRARADDAVLNLTAEVERHMFAPTRGPVTELDALFGSLRMQTKLRHRVRGLLWALLTPTIADYNVLPLPQALMKLYYFLRPARILFKYGPKLARIRPQNNQLR